MEKSSELLQYIRDKFEKAHSDRPLYRAANGQYGLLTVELLWQTWFSAWEASFQFHFMERGK